MGVVPIIPENERRKTMKLGKYSLNLFIIVLFVILNIASSITLASEDTQKPDQSTAGQRRYSPMSVEEAKQLVEKIIKNKDVPPPRSSDVFSWKLPETSLYAQGIKINDNDYVVFAHTEPTTILFLPKENLSEFLPKIEKIPLEPGDGTNEVVFLLNGIIFSTVDLEVVNNSIFEFTGEKYNRKKQVVEKGGYVCYIGAMGILLKTGGNKTLIISFEELISGFSFKGSISGVLTYATDGSFYANVKDRPTLYKGALSISPGGHVGILVEVAGQVIQLK